MPLIAFIASTFVLFAIFYLISELAQKFFYDDVVDGLWWRALVCAVPLAFVVVRFPLAIDTMFTEQPHITIPLAILWFLMFWLVFRFQVAHAAMLAPALFLIVTPLLTIGLQSFLAPAPVPGLPVSS